MPLKRAQSLLQADEAGVDFEMITPTRTAIRCLVTRAALDAPCRSDGSITIDEHLGVFKQLRDLIEGAASQKYDCGQLERGMVVVRPEDVMAARGRMQ